MNHPLQLYRPVRTPKADTLYNWIEQYMAVRYNQCSFQTYSAVRYRLEQFEIFLSNRPITKPLLLEWMMALNKKPWSPDYYNRAIIAVKGFLKWCEINDLLTGSPYIVLGCKPSPQKPRPPIFTEAEYERIKEATKGTPYHYLVVLSYRTGMSLVDCCFLRWQSVDMNKLFIESSRIKMSRRARSCTFKIPIIAGSDIHLLLQNMLNNKVDLYGNSNDEYVNPYLAGVYKLYGKYQNTGNRPMSDYFRLLFKKLGIKGKSFRHFRHTLLSHLANTEGNMALACQISGHCDPKTFMTYVRPDDEALRTMMMKAQAWAEKQKEKK